MVIPMALFGRDRDREQRARTPEPDRAAAQPAPGEVAMFEREHGTIRGAEGAALTAFLGKGTRITGNLVFEGPCRIEGHVEGEVSAQDTLTVGETAVVNARVNGTMIVIHGTVTGDVVASTRLEIRAPGKIIGDVTTPSLVINEGAMLEGRCSMRTNAMNEETRAASSSAAPTSPQLHVG
jgi:cytoskeletal protein CcmA (bactofilin family)